MYKYYFWIIAFCIYSHAAMCDSIHFFDLKNRSAEEIIPILQPLLQPQEAISGDGFQLFIKTSDKRAQEIEQILATIDRSAKMFRVSVTNDEHLAHAQNDLDASVRVTSGDAEIHVNEDRYSDADVSVHANAQNYTNSRHKEQFLNIQEGKPAFLSRENIRLLPSYSYYINRHGVEIIDHGRTPYASEDGFYVEARSADSEFAQVRIQTVQGINDHHSNYEYEQQFAETTLRVPLGKWFEIGGNTQTTERSEKGILYRTQEKEQRFNKIFLKIELAK